MQVVEAELKILRISESVSLPFESFYFVDQPLDGAAGDAMLEVVEKSGPVGSEGLANSFERLDSGLHGVSAPHGKELFGLFAALLFPKEPQLLFH